MKPLSNHCIVDKLVKFHPRKVTNPADNKELNKTE
jgi:hypothetical protein